VLLEKNYQKYNVINTETNLKGYLNIQNREFENLYENYKDLLNLTIKPRNKNFISTFLNPRENKVDQKNKLKQIRSKIGFGSSIKESKNSMVYRSSRTNFSYITPVNSSLRNSINLNDNNTANKIHFSHGLHMTNSETPIGTSHKRNIFNNLTNQKININKIEQQRMENLKIILKGFKKEGLIK
jgi:hypothetical protein